MDYNNNGFMSKDYIGAILKRYEIEKTFVCQIINYKKYNGQDKDKHYFSIIHTV